MTPPSSSLPRPIVIESAAGPLFVWYHAPPDGAAAAGEGVVLCNPLGYDAVCSHRTYRELAERLAAAGYPSLRFDYHGTGDSSGADADPGRVEAMLDGIKTAAAALKSLSGAEEISLFGVRMGASLAMRAAAELDGVKSVAAWAPCVKGKAYLREMTAFRMMAEKNPGQETEPSGLPEGDEEAGGFLMTKETIASLSDLDLLELKAAPARRVLLIAREGTAVDPALAAGLRRLGSDVAEEDIPGYAAMMTDAHKSIVPDRILEKVIRWFSQGPKRAGKNPARRADVLITDRMRIRPAEEAGSEVIEQPLYFGKHGNVFGIVCENAEQARRSKTAVIFLNAGHIHRIGPNRFYTRFARRWAALGVTCLRLDLSGIGDSPGERPPGEPSFTGAAAKNIDEAMSLLRSTRSIKRFALIGLCSGAYTAFHASLRSRSVAAEILVNPPAFYSRPGGTSINNYNESLSHKRALLRKKSWGKALRGEVDFSHVFKVAVERSRNVAKETAATISDIVLRRERSDDDLLQAFRRMAKRKVNTFLVFSRNDGGIPDIEQKLGSRAGKAAGPDFKFEIVDGADHTFSPLRSQDRLYALLTEHVSRLLGA